MKVPRTGRYARQKIASMRKIFHMGAGCRFLSIASRDLKPALIKVLRPSGSTQPLLIVSKEFRQRSCTIHGRRDAAHVLTGLKDSYASAVADILDVCIHRTAFLKRTPVPAAVRDGHDQPGGLQPPLLRGPKLVFLTP